MTIESKGFIANNPFAARAHTERPEELALEDTVLANKIRNRVIKPGG